MHPNLEKAIKLIENGFDPGDIFLPKLTVSDLIAFLSVLPPDYKVRAYEGEDTGIVVESPEKPTKNYFIEAW
jgi:hypothetical protein